MNGWSEDRSQALMQAEQAADRAIALDTRLPVAHFVRGLVYRERGEYDDALAEAGQAVVLDPNYANAHVLLATLLYYTGRPQEGLEMIRKAMQLNPHHPYNYPFHLGQAYFILQRYPDACTAFEQGLQSNPSSERLHVWLAAAYALAGRSDDASWEAEQVLTLNPEFSLQRMQQSFPFRDPADLSRFLEGLRIAGFT
jgi:adenylate cyclase